MRGLAAWQLIAVAATLLVSACSFDFEGLGLGGTEKVAVAEVDPVPPPAPEPPPTPIPAPQVKVADVMQNGVVIAISKASQHMYVFRNGVLWDSSPVSTGKRGKETPSGTFAILQKRRHHRSNLYSNAPMPFMQRLTWDGIAIHAGRLPGYPASHGCIRLPHGFASDLFKLTGFMTTAVIVTNDPLETEQAAYALASANDETIPIEERMLEKEFARSALTQIAAALSSDGAPVSPAPVHRPHPRRAAAPEETAPIPAGEEVIQLAAASSLAEAEAHWERVVRDKPELAKMRKTVVPATVDGRQYYRLRASSRDAHTTCDGLKQSGVECFPVS